MQTSRPKPQSINPVEWAEYNADRPLAIMTDVREVALSEAIHRFEESPESIALEPIVIASDTPAARILEDAINRAVADLEGQGSRSDRIALQLLTALALYAAEVGK